VANNLTVIVLAAGGGTRMKSKTMKVLHPVCGRSMIGHVLLAVQAVRPQTIVAVVGHQREQVSAHIASLVPGALLAVQETQDGTGHAVRVAMEAAGATTGTVLVAAGDTPLLEGESLRAFAEEHEAAQRAVSILSGVVERPFGYGRVVRNAEGDVEAIVEEKDATVAQREIREINSGILAFDAEFLAEALPKLSNDNAKGEYYLTDTVQIARDAGLTVGAHVIDDVMQTEGANDRVQLAALGRELNRRILTRWMRDGVTVMDPDTTWVDADVVLAEDVTILPGTQLLGATVVGEDAVIGPDTTLKDCEVGDGARVVRTHAELAVVGPRSSVGPFSYLRPGTRLGAGGKIGGFVETKNAAIGDGAKVPHLSYVGDAEIGEGTNIGAGTIFANYDGVAKHKTTIGRHARTASNNTFVAPVTVGDGAATGAGTVVRRDVPPGALAVSSGPQRNIERWAQRKRPGTPQADAADAATSGAEGQTSGERDTSHEGPGEVGQTGPGGGES
jgi:bifunctional UDP-N-acetylglucosamine pyrophosphorylase/glucosamine-1-phosphate N-acetyltransferase